MKRKGFTLIELLAVIVILAIIAIIATPIVLNIIKDSKVSASARSAENYLDAVENAIVKENLNGKEFKPLTCTVTSDDGKTLSCNMSDSTTKDLNVELNGKVAEKGAILEFNKENVTAVSNFKIDGKEIPASSLGLEEAITTKTVYRWSKVSKKIGDPLTSSDYTLDPTTLGHNYYLKHTLDKDNQIIESYACAKFNGETERCLKGAYGTTYGWVTSKTDSTGRVAKLYEIEQEQISNVICKFNNGTSTCRDGSVYLDADSSGGVDAYDGSGLCFVYAVGSSGCVS